MFQIKDAYATVWSVEDKGTTVKGRISTSEKDKRNEGKYINSNWFVTFVGKAKDKALTLSARDRIKILSGKVANTLFGEGENKKSYLNVTVFDFEAPNNGGQSSSQSNGQGFYPIDEDDELPF
jgi:hypothetical protein